jgi:hypothetical protein
VRRFQLIRKMDVTGISGTGAVIQGVQFADGVCVIRWMTVYPSTTIHNSIENIIAVHGHEGLTELEWIDP